MEKELKNKERHIGYEVRTLDNMIGRRVNCWHSKMDEEVGITRMQAWIIGYVYEHSEKPVFQKDLEENFQVVDMIKNNIEKEDFHDKNIIEPGKGV